MGNAPSSLDPEQHHDHHPGHHDHHHELDHPRHSADSVDNPKRRLLRESLAPLEAAGLHVLSVVPGSPAAAAGLCVFFDFIVAVDDRQVTADCESTLSRWMAAARVDGRSSLAVWNSRTGALRKVNVDLRSDSGERALGVSVRPNSPAEHAALHPRTDYIVAVAAVDGTYASQSQLKSRDSLFELLESRIGFSIPLVIYSSVLDAFRTVKLTPKYGWGGDGCIGADIGYGPQHRIPPSVFGDDKFVEAVKSEEKPLMRIVSHTLHANHAESNVNYTLDPRHDHSSNGLKNHEQSGTSGESMVDTSVPSESGQNKDRSEDLREHLHSDEEHRKHSHEHSHEHGGH
ncbi:hypothetical protein HDU84_002366 [Entophlyctis sp. JEL0112]|nr:hypothetical protein HDU84_002366 [Entophlyctis sp. JEL0112]